MSRHSPECSPEDRRRTKVCWPPESDDVAEVGAAVDVAAREGVLVVGEESLVGVAVEERQRPFVRIHHHHPRVQSDGGVASRVPSNRPWFPKEE